MLTDEFLKFQMLGYMKLNEFPDVISSINPKFCCIYIKWRFIKFYPLCTPSPKLYYKFYSPGVLNDPKYIL